MSTSETDTVSIPNHIAPKLSELDMETIRHIPPGGNWMNVPKSVPSKRLAQIRESYAAGKGSRSTYYGRLLKDDPSYTISTYFTRPGNGCNIHYSQDRTLSFREAARLQSFPDSFVFEGSKSAIADQIGNAVPPLLGYHIADALPEKRGAFVDLFSGAGGLALGFFWNGWIPIVANDLSQVFLDTHARNFPCPTVAGDITADNVKQRIVAHVEDFRRSNPGVPIWVLGGPPCQGFSTANGGRSSSDMRNWLFREYISLMKMIHPDGFVFENVTGILNLDGGQFFEMIKSELAVTVEAIKVEKVSAANFGVPQRRNRVIVVGGSKSLIESARLSPITVAPPVVRRSERAAQADLLGARRAITVGEAISDLPEIEQSEDGSRLEYKSLPQSRYQAFMRGQISPADFAASVR